jgi:peptidoglycan-associated lipoprotein
MKVRPGPDTLPDKIYGGLEMKFLWKRPPVLILLLLAVVSFSCKKNTPVAPPAPIITGPGAPTTTTAAAVPTILLSANTTAITAGQSATLTYTATNATSVTLQPGIGAVQPTTTGTRQVTPTTATTYTATATGPGGTAQSAGVTISVNAAAAATPPPPPPVVTPRVDTAGIDQLFTQNMTPVLFDYDKSTIRPGEDTKLDRMATWLKQNPTVRLTVEGHADERGGQEYNIALGDDRAAAVKRYLQGQGVSDSRIIATSYGEERPACRAQTEDCWQQNRRAAFVRNP